MQNRHRCDADFLAHRVPGRLVGQAGRLHRRVGLMLGGHREGRPGPEDDEHGGQDRHALAQRAVRGDYFATGAEMAKRRRKDVKINTEVRDLPPAKKPKRK